MDGPPNNPGHRLAPVSPITTGRPRPDGEVALDSKTRIRNSRSRQRAETRERIFEAALREFRRVGFAAAQIDRIAKNAGIARGTFYFHFPTKDDVMLELARRINRRLSRRMALAVETNPSLHGFLTQLADLMIDEFGRVSDVGLNAELIALYVRRPTDLRDAIHSVPSVNSELVEHFRRISDGRTFPTATSPEQLAKVVLSSLFGILARVPREEGARDACQALIDLLIVGLEARDP